MFLLLQAILCWGVAYNLIHYNTKEHILIEQGPNTFVAGGHYAVSFIHDLHYIDLLFKNTLRNLRDIQKLTLTIEAAMSKSHRKQKIYASIISSHRYRSQNMANKLI